MIRLGMMLAAVMAMFDGGRRGSRKSGDADLSRAGGRRGA
jgi:hypothetical protein